jgi:tetratricopeptide (TPR) repeat protein
MAVVEARLARKRVYKARGRRRSEDRPVATGAPTELVVTNDEAHRFVHHPLSPADIKGLVALMPAEPGIDLLAVRLRTGRHEEAMRGKPDPLVGRPSNDTEGPVWAPTLLGLYRGLPKEIDLFGYVYDPAQLRAPQVQLVLLWLKQAHTLAHEVAHCWDDGARAGRDWSGIAISRRTEAYAAKMANAWLVSHAVPYFRAKHRAAALAFEAWLAEELGVPISLDDVARDVDRELWGLAIGLTQLASTWGDTSALDARVAVAEQLHFTDEFAKAREVLEAVLDEEPRHVRAWALMGDVAVHERDWDRALAVTEAAVDLAPTDPDIAEDRVDALVGAKRWDDAVTACHHALGLASSKSGDWRRGRMVAQRVHCYLEMKQYEQAKVDLEDLAQANKGWWRQWSSALTAEMLIGQGSWAEAHELAATALFRRLPLVQRAFLVAAKWEAGRRLGISSPQPVPTERQLRVLRHQGREAWAERLLSLGLVPSRDRPPRRQVDLLDRAGPAFRP